MLEKAVKNLKLAVALLLLITTSGLKAQTVVNNIPGGIYTNIGSGSAYLQVLPGGSPVKLIISATQPQNNAPGMLIYPGQPPLPISSTTLLWASSVGGSNLVVTPVSITGAVSVANGIQGTTVGGAVPSGSNVLITKPAPIVSSGAPQLALSVNTATSLTVPTGTLYALFCAEGQNVRWRDDGSSPTATAGILLQAGTCLPYLYQGPISSIQFIGVASGATVDVSYYK